MVAAVTDTLDDLAARVADTGASMDQRAPGAIELIEAGTRPESTAALVAITRRLDAIAEATAVLEQLPNGLAALVDVADELAASAAERGARLDVAGDRLTAAAAAAVSVLGDPDLDGGPERIGLFGLLKALRDPDVQRALALGVRLARAVGVSLRTQEGNSDE